MTATRYNGRAQRVRDYLVAHPKGATNRELIIAVEPGCRPNNMAGTIAGMVASNKLRADDSCVPVRYFVTADANIDRRLLANATGKASKPATGRTPAQLEATRLESARRAATRAKAAKRSCPTSAIRAALTRETVRSPDLQPATSPIEGAETVAEFLARGGRVQRLRIGDMAHTRNPQHRAFQVPKQSPGAP